MVEIVWTKYLVCPSHESQIPSICCECCEKRGNIKNIDIFPWKLTAHKQKQTYTHIVPLHTTYFTNIKTHHTTKRTIKKIPVHNDNISLQQLDHFTLNFWDFFGCKVGTAFEIKINQNDSK